ncbi:MAG: hypothetical protein P0Y65_13500 [Candidatus Devosia phytovorans]|uniref:Uncharacterized protein n=1 Tax=Candidatus Devosia phytovorans TaxID=3121372 RepID=A0AAJ5VTU0_9HYPH|nr:hypothetical protein [Devosia sp.]WEK03214.1 MAG: hypothetical protein P0Y65_13500 [Devosia sp.]
MNAADADQRIILSRHTLKRYGQLTTIGQSATHEDVLLIDKELEILDAIAAQFPEKVPKLLRLVAEWLTFRDRIQVTLH